MVPFLLAEAIRRARRPQRSPRRPSPALPWRVLLAGELRHLARLPATVVVLSGAVAAVAVFVALGSAYPGPVAHDAIRGSLVTLVLVASVGMVRTLPATWSEVGDALPTVRLAVLVTVAGGLVGLVKVGLHDTTPGPALGSTWRWLVVVLTVLVGSGVLGRRTRP